MCITYETRTASASKLVLDKRCALYDMCQCADNKIWTVKYWRTASGLLVGLAHTVGACVIHTYITCAHDSVRLLPDGSTGHWCPFSPNGTTSPPVNCVYTFQMQTMRQRLRPLCEHIYMYSLIWSSCPPWRRLYHSFCGCNRGVCVQLAKGGGGECMRIIRSARPNARVKWRTLCLQFSVFLQLLALKMYAHTCNNQWIIVLPELVSRRHALVQLTLEKAIYVAIACLTAANKT